MRRVNYLTIPSKRHLIGKILFAISLLAVAMTWIWHKEATATLESSRWRALPSSKVEHKKIPKDEREAQQAQKVLLQLHMHWEPIFGGLETVLPEDFELKGMTADYAAHAVKLDVSKTELPRAPMVAGELAKQPWVESAILSRHAEREGSDDVQEVEAAVDIRWRDEQ